MPITSINKPAIQLDPGRSVEILQFKGNINVKNESSDQRAAYRIMRDGSQQEGTLDPGASTTVEVSSEQKEVRVTNTSASAKISVGFTSG